MVGVGGGVPLIGEGVNGSEVLTEVGVVVLVNLIALVAANVLLAVGVEPKCTVAVDVKLFTSIGVIILVPSVTTGGGET